jgi:hypothetical protein
MTKALSPALLPLCLVRGHYQSEEDVLIVCIKPSCQQLGIGTLIGRYAWLLWGHGEGRLLESRVMGLGGRDGNTRKTWPRVWLSLVLHEWEDFISRCVGWDITVSGQAVRLDRSHEVDNTGHTTTRTVLLSTKIWWLNSVTSIEL